eukprot:1027385-Amphidinium_carterae.1
MGRPRSMDTIKTTQLSEPMLRGKATSLCYLSVLILDDQSRQRERLWDHFCLTTAKPPRKKAQAKNTIRHDPEIEQTSSTLLPRVRLDGRFGP